MLIMLGYLDFLIVGCVRVVWGCKCFVFCFVLGCLIVDFGVVLGCCGLPTDYCVCFDL